MSYYELEAEKKNYLYFKYDANPKEFITYAHFHSAIELVFVEKGTQESVLGGEKRILQAGDACFSDSFCVHSYVKSVNAAAYTIVGDKLIFERLFSSFGNKILPKFFTFHDFALLKNLYQLYQNSQQNPTGRYAINEGAMSILLGAISQNTEFVPRKILTQDTLICDVLKYAHEHLDKDLSLRAVAKKFGYSYEHLSRTLNKNLSENWNSYINRLRVRRANQLLQEDSTSTVLEIALACGFDSPNTFYRAYKKEYGISPRHL